MHSGMAQDLCLRDDLKTLQETWPSIIDSGKRVTGGTDVCVHKLAC